MAKNLPAAVNLQNPWEHLSGGGASGGWMDPLPLGVHPFKNPWAPEVKQRVCDPGRKGKEWGAPPPSPSVGGKRPDRHLRYHNVSVIH